MAHALFWPVLVFLIVGFGIQLCNVKFPQAFVRLVWLVTQSIMIATLIILFVDVIYYLIVPGYFDHVEENIASVAAFWKFGNPLYHAVDSANQYALLYGPLAAVINAGFQVGRLDIFFVSKLPGIMSFFVGWLLLAILLWRKSDWSFAKKVTLLAVYAAILIYNEDMSFWNRPDSYILLFAIAALFIVEVETSTWRVAVMTGVLAGLASAGKIHAAGAILPLVVYYCERVRPKNVAMPAIVFLFAASIAAGFWFLLPGISLSNYLAVLHHASAHGLKVRQFLVNVSFILPPIVFLILVGFHRKFPWTFSVLALMCLLTSLVASKAGAGAYHLLPYLPLLLYFGALAESELEPKSKQNARTFALCCFLGIFTQVPKEQKDIMRFWHRQPKTSEHLQDLRTLELKYPGPKTMAPTDDDNYDLMQLTPELVAKGGRLFLDSPQIMDLVLGGGQLPEATYQALLKCEIPEFVLPSKGEPWAMTDWYSRTPLYPDRLRTVFNASYEKIDTVGVFALYRCKQNLPLGQN